MQAHEPLGTDPIASAGSCSGAPGRPDGPPVATTADEIQLQVQYDALLDRAERVVRRLLRGVVGLE